MTETAKIFMTGGSQAVRLPLAFRFNSSEVFISRDPVSGNVILSERPTNWDSFIEAATAADFPDDFLSPKDRNQGIHNRDPFEESGA